MAFLFLFFTFALSLCVVGLQPEFAQGGVIIGPSSQWPTVLALGFFDWEIVDAGDASAHQSLLIKFPVLVAIAAEPIAAIVMPFVSKPYRDTVFAKCPDFLDQAIIQLLVPFAR
jgi:2-keto-3-deoxy-L-rhamnonate aldolase RhmA